MWDILTHKWLKIPYTLHVSTHLKAKKPRATLLFIHGLGNSGAAWNEVIERLDTEPISIISIDLLGFGQSPKPEWAIYSAKTQARSVIATLVKLRLRQPVVIIGHSLGALVAVEIARRYPLLVKALVLYGPPFYKPDTAQRHLHANSDKMLRDLYQLVRSHPEESIKIATLARKLGIVNKTFRLDHDLAPSYMNTLEASIINQTSLEDALKIRTPTRIIYGKLDPVVITKNLQFLANTNSAIHLTPILSAHEVQGALAVRAVVGAIRDTIA